MEGRPVFVLFGPTASGKTELLSGLFSERGRKTPSVEIVSADSMQVYRGMDIGTAKPSLELRRRFPHHLIDIRNPGEQFNAGDFVRLAGQACADIHSRGKLPVVSGGTGFYLKNFILGLSGAPPSDPAVRDALKKELAEKGAEALMEELAEKDGESAARIHVNDIYRLLRALEVLRLSGRPLSSFALHGTPPPCRFLVVELSRPREELYGRIEKRCAEMFRLGLADEVEGLFRKGYTPEDPGMRAIGYREFFVGDQPPSAEKTWRLSGDIDGVMELVIRDSRRYAKRQLTFFASIPKVVKVPPEGAFDRILDLLSALLHTQQS
ncbi:MAG: tRNA (adenosine(37)-N6)-dimethylallyltransferase MiaA [Treponema sp.]|jgi:tRNA dimethylallyltransferase|nr:tRNA (adenosine(37)-N6)-dimethylallyltransferase MiaA [Treponema sp.]